MSPMLFGLKKKTEQRNKAKLSEYVCPDWGHDCKRFVPFKQKLNPEGWQRMQGRNDK